MCESGHIMKPHKDKDDGYEFATTSWQRFEQNVNVYRTCVENRGTDDRSLWIDWRIPGPHGYIAPQDSAKDNRFSAHHDSKDVTDVVGCLMYGSYRKPIKVQFIGDLREAERAKEEGDCSQIRAQQAQADQFSGESPWFVADGRISMPSDSKDIKGTLIRFVYQVGMRPAPGGYEMTLSYRAGPVFPETFHGDITGIKLRSSLSLVSDAIRRSGRDGGEGAIRLQRYEDVFALPMELPKPFALEEVRYGFFDLNGALVAEIHAPVLTPASR